MESISTSLPSEGGLEGQVKDTLVLAVCQQERAHSGETLASGPPTARSDKLAAYKESTYTETKHIVLQAFDPDAFSVPMFNEGSSSLTPLHHLRSNPPAAEWKIVEKPMIFLADGTLVQYGDQKVHFVEIHFPVHEPGFRKFRELPVEIQLMIWKCALPNPRVLYLNIDCEPRERRQKYRPMKWARPVDELPPPPPDYFRLKLYLESNYDPYFLNMARICKESRKIFLQNYSRLKYRNKHVDLPWNNVRNNWLREDYDGTKARLVPQRRYIDFRRDTLEITREYLDSLEARDGWVDLTRVENFAFCAVDEIPQNPAQAYFNNSWWLWDFVKKNLPSLKTLTLTLGTVEIQKVHHQKATLNFVNIGEDTPSTIRQQPRLDIDGTWSRPDGMANENALIKSAKKIAKQTKKEIQKRVSANESLQSLKIDVTLTSTKFRRLSKQSENVWLIPTNPKYHGVCFYANRPAVIGVTDRQYFHALKFGTPCNIDGSIGTPAQDSDTTDVINERTM
jgi:hypothetical protein